jgi:hypothetical protein
MSDYMPAILTAAFLLWIVPHLWHWLGKPIGKRYGHRRHRKDYD